MFSATEWGGTSMKCWWTMPMPCAMASCGDRKDTRWPLDEDLTGLRPIQPRQDVHQGALPGAVLAEQRVHLALPAGEIHAVVGQHAGKALDDPAHLDGVRGIGHGSLTGRPEVELAQELSLLRH